MQLYAAHAKLNTRVIWKINSVYSYACWNVFDLVCIVHPTIIQSKDNIY